MEMHCDGCPRPTACWEASKKDEWWVSRLDTYIHYWVSTLCYDYLHYSVCSHPLSLSLPFRNWIGYLGSERAASLRKSGCRNAAQVRRAPRHNSKDWENDVLRARRLSIRLEFGIRSWAFECQVLLLTPLIRTPVSSMVLACSSLLYLLLMFIFPSLLMTRFQIYVIHSLWSMILDLSYLPYCLFFRSLRREF